jgi:transcription initiation protein SPT3
VVVMAVEPSKSKLSRMVPTVRTPTLAFFLFIDSLPDKLAAKAQKITIKLPWEISTIYSEILRQSGHQSDDEEDEDDIEAHEASIQRLKEADDATRQMTREEYQHYSDCRQASFTYRKGSCDPTFLLAD